MPRKHIKEKTMNLLRDKITKIPYDALIIAPIISLISEGVLFLIGCLLRDNPHAIFVICTIFIMISGIVIINMFLLSRKIRTDLKESRETNDLKSSFLANMSHEIRTPINAVLSMDEMILRESNDNNVLEYANDIKRAGESLLVIINDILDFSKIEAGKMEIIPDAYCTKELIKDIKYMFEEKAAEKGLQYTVEISQDIPCELQGDATRIKQIIINVVNNAIKYTQKGSVRVKFFYSEKEGLIIEVKDTGIGIKKEDKARLFSKFERLEEKKNKNIQGTGLGMSITKQLLEIMGGTISVESTYGKGSTFLITIPQKVLSTVKLEEKDIIQSGEVEKNNNERFFFAPDAKILIVDDNELNLKSMSLLLKRNELRVDLADSGKKCLALCKKERYDIIFVDHMMPEMDGIEVFNRLKKDIQCKLNAATPVIMLTANAANGIDVKFKKMGFADYLSKPVNIHLMEDVLKKYIPWGNYISNNEIIEKTKHKGNVTAEIKAQKANDDKVFFSVETGLLNLENEKNLNEMICFFYKNETFIMEELDDLQRNNDIEGYTVKVHALKSSARLIGFLKLSYLCELLERAGKQKNTDYISRNHQLIRKVCEKTFEDPEVIRFIRNDSTHANDKNSENNKNGKKGKNSVNDITEIINKLNKYIDGGDINGLDQYYSEIEGDIKNHPEYPTISKSVLNLTPIMINKDEGV